MRRYEHAIATGRRRHFPDLRPNPRIQRYQQAEQALTLFSSPVRSPREAPHPQGALLLAKSDPSAALTMLRRAVQLWIDIDCPYQVALQRMRLAEAFRLLGEDDAAMMELDAARKVFVSLGATPEARKAAQLLGERAHADDLSDREVEVLRLVALANRIKR